MRTLIISDIHANLTALEAVLSAANPFDCVWCLGDLVGYGPDPNACIERIRDLPGLKCVKGNHDAAILGDIDIYAFNHEARASLEWLETELDRKSRRWLESLEERITFDDFTLVHGSPTRPIWEYVLDVRTARQNMDKFSTKICLVGHTHVPCIYQVMDNSPKSTRLQMMTSGLTFAVENKAIINPGSVGQPRDHDPRASFLVFDDEENLWHYHRVSYDIQVVQARILAAGLPSRHASRLEDGW